MNCYLCNHQINFFLKKNGFSIYRCPDCGLAQTDLSMRYDKFVKAHYTKGYFVGDPSRSAYSNYKDDKANIVRNMEKFLKKILQHKQSGRLLDVGCAMGFFVELATKHGFEASGFDPSDFAISEAKKIMKDKVQIGTVDSVVYPPKSFDIITLFDVFEHLANPRENLQKLGNFLKDDGIIVIATGDTGSLLPKLIGRRWTFYIPPQHLYFFNKSTAVKILDQAGFKLSQWFRIGKWLSLSYVLLLAKTTGESRLGAWLYHLVNNLGIGNIPLYLPVGDNMVLIAKKDNIV